MLGICLFDGMFLEVWLVCGDFSIIILEGFGDMCLISGERGFIFGETFLILGDIGRILDDCAFILTNWVGEEGFCIILDWDCT